MQYILTQEDMDELKSGITQELKDLQKANKKLEKEIKDIRKNGEVVLANLPDIQRVGPDTFMGTSHPDPRYEGVQMYLEELTGKKREEVLDQRIDPNRPFTY